MAQEIPSWSQILQSLIGRKIEQSGFFLNKVPGLIPHLGALWIVPGAVEISTSSPAKFATESWTLVASHVS